MKSTHNSLILTKKVSKTDTREFYIDPEHKFFIKQYTTIPKNKKHVQSLIRTEFERGNVLSQFIPNFIKPIKHTKTTIIYPYIKNLISIRDLLKSNRSLATITTAKDTPSPIPNSPLPTLNINDKALLIYIAKLSSYISTKLLQKGFLYGDLATDNIGIQMTHNATRIYFFDAGPTPLCPNIPFKLSKLTKQQLQLFFQCQNSIFIHSIFIGLFKHLLTPRSLAFRIKLARIYIKHCHKLLQATSPSPKCISILSFTRIILNEIKRTHGTSRIKAIIRAPIMLILFFMISFQ